MRKKFTVNNWHEMRWKITDCVHEICRPKSCRDIVCSASSSWESINKAQKYVIVLRSKTICVPNIFGECGLRYQGGRARIAKGSGWPELMADASRDLRRMKNLAAAAGIPLRAIVSTGLCYGQRDGYRPNEGWNMVKQNCNSQCPRER